jgi:hypothetical protein
MQMSEIPDDLNKKLLDEAGRIINAANENNVTMRLLGSIAFRYHCPKYVKYLDVMDRKLTDLDFASYSSERDKVEKLLAEMGYTTQSYVLIAAVGLGRSLYWKEKDNEVKIDIFWDRLKMNHTVDFAGRLEFDNPTIPLSELLQEKLQIVKLNAKDVKDSIVLLLEHEVNEGSRGKDVIDIAPILQKASTDWGYYYTFATNLRRIQDYLLEMDMLSEQEKSTVRDRISMILVALENVPKSLSWRLRARVGVKKKWYMEVQ